MFLTPFVLSDRISDRIEGFERYRHLYGEQSNAKEKIW